MIINKRNEVGNALKLTFIDSVPTFLFRSFTNRSGTRARNAIAAAMKNIVLKSKLKNQNRTKASIEPRIAPPVSMAL